MKRGRKSAAELAIVLTSPEPIATRPGGSPAPAHLKPATATWWTSVVADYSLEPHHLRLLQAACEAWDRMQAARAVIDKEGLTFEDRNGEPRVRPEISIERDSRIAFARLVRELDLDVDAPGEGRSRLPALLSNRRL